MLHQSDVPNASSVPPPVTPALFCPVLKNGELANISNNVEKDENDILTSV